MSKSGNQNEKKIFFNSIIFLVIVGELKENGEISGHRGSPSAISYSPDGSKIAIGDSNRELCVWDAASKSCKFFLFILTFISIKKINY